MKKREIEFLRKRKFVIGIPIVVKFKLMNPKEFRKFKATRGTEVVKWKDILKLKSKKKKNDTKRTNRTPTQI